MYSTKYRLGSLFSVFLALIALFGLQAIPVFEASAQNNSDAAIVVNGETASEGQIDRRVQKQLEQITSRAKKMSPEKKEAMEKRIRDRVVQKTVDDLVVKTKARERGIAVTEEEVEEEFKRVSQQFPSDTAFERLLEKRNTSRDELRSNIRLQLVKSKMLSENFEEPEVTEKEVRKFYENNKKRMKGSSFEEVRDTLKQRLRSKKRNRQMQRLISELREESEIQNRLS